MTYKSHLISLFGFITLTIPTGVLSKPSLLEDLETYLTIPSQERALTFAKSGENDSVTFHDAHLKITSTRPNDYLSAFQRAQNGPVLLTVTLEGPSTLDATLIPSSVQCLFMECCTLPVSNYLIEDIGKLPSLSSLTIMGHPIDNWRHINPTLNAPLRPTFTSLAPLQNLRTLRLESMKFMHLPEDISALTKLESLSLARNYDLLELPKGLKSLSNLEALNIAHTHVTQVPEWIRELSALKELRLGYMDDERARVRTEWRTYGLPQGQDLTLPMDALLQMENLVVYITKQAAAPYMESATKNGLTRTHTPDRFVVEPRHHQSRLQYLWSSYGLFGAGPRKVIATRQKNQSQ
ncbi:MAG: hypothetical protein LCH26_05395 [Proteobacteria bacterium]|nr:hypothetical protein [Pseudomonadota bacterium]